MSTLYGYLYGQIRASSAKRQPVQRMNMAFLDSLAVAGITEITVQFDGCGDSDRSRTSPSIWAKHPSLPAAVPRH